MRHTTLLAALLLACATAVPPTAEATVTVTPPAGWSGVSVLIARWDMTGETFAVYRSAKWSDPGAGCAFGVPLGGANGTLFDPLTIVHGTTGNDEIRVADLDGISFCGLTWNKVALGSSGWLDVDGRSGGDLFTGPASPRTRYYGGAGADTFSIGAASKIYGGDGTDIIMVRSAFATQAFGENHNDSHCGFAGSDTFAGGAPTALGGFDTSYGIRPAHTSGVDLYSSSLTQCSVWLINLVAAFTD